VTTEQRAAEVAEFYRAVGIEALAGGGAGDNDEKDEGEEGEGERGGEGSQGKGAEGGGEREGERAAEGEGLVGADEGRDAGTSGETVGEGLGMDLDAVYSKSLSDRFLAQRLLRQKWRALSDETRAAYARVSQVGEWVGAVCM
jgi:hypothetical protein